MDLIKKILNPERSWSDINNDLNNLKRTDVQGRIGMKLTELLVKHDKPKLLEKLFAVVGETDFSFTDRYGRTVLHLAVENRSTASLKVLLKHGGTNIIDKRDRFWFFSPLHFTILNNDIESARILIENGADVNLKADHSDLKNTNIDEAGFMYPNRIRPIHLASFGGKLEILKLLVENGARLNPHAEKDGLTALFMAAIEYTNENINDSTKHVLMQIIKYLISNGANIKAVNYDGENLLYYQNIWNNDELWNMFAPHINVNSINYNRDTVLSNHLLLKKNVGVSKKDIQKHRQLLESMDSFYINYPNTFYMETLTHLYSQNGMWKHLEDILVQKYLDIYTPNRDGNRPLDYIESHDKPRYFKMVARGYSWCLKHCPNVKFVKKWERVCASDVIKESDNAVLQKIAENKSTSRDQLCTLVAAKMISKSKKSYPDLKESVHLSAPSEFKINWWSATSFEVFFGIMYLVKKYPEDHVCFLKDFDFITKPNDIRRYHSINDFFEDNVTKFCFLWQNDVLTFNPKYRSAIKGSGSSGKGSHRVKAVPGTSKALGGRGKSRFFIIPLALNYGRSNEGHFNSILIDNKMKSIERFEPHGYKSSWYHNQKLMDSKISSVLLKLLPGYTYVTPREYISRIGFQGYDSTTTKYDVTQFVDMAYCIVWSLWYLDLRLRNPDVPRNKVIERAMLKIHKNFTSTKKFIMAYANGILKKRDKFLKSCGINIDDYVAEQTGVEDIKCLLGRIRTLLSDF